ncbi:hypothetical protein GEM_4247 [Burkholderia cepacia GG4]|uniref:Uncharacterized protein n=1 Tax=Burkholderia cepacia GG4 TaxID=1009846 RepID=A0A9W3K478_BURCE|nr:hypothetical protein GEM_4247 [Burkholderia cepacia GG4]
MVLLSVIARPTAFRCTRPASASGSAAAATADHPGAGPVARADRPDRRARAGSGRDRRRGSVRGGAGWIGGSCRSSASARACRLTRRPRASSVPERLCNRATGHASSAATSCTCRGELHRERERTGRRGWRNPRPWGGPRRQYGSVHGPRPSRRTCTLGPTSQRFTLPWIEPLAPMAEITAAYVRVVTYPFSGFLHHAVFSSTPAAGGPCVRRPGWLDGCKRHVTDTARYDACSRRYP